MTRPEQAGEGGARTFDRQADPCVIVIFGAAGDLTKRKLLPALHNLRTHGLLTDRFAIMGVARRELPVPAFRDQMASEVQALSTTARGPSWSELASRLYYSHGDFGAAATYDRLATQLDELERRHQTGGNVVFYLATPPTVFGDIAAGLGRAGLLAERDGRWRRVIVEKPFGRDLASAEALSAELHKVLAERQIFRIDHYLGKETVQNLLVFRFGNGVIEPVWNRRYVDHVQITVAEDLGVEKRGGYYDQAGVLRDMVQNHMFQLLALAAMEPPSSLAAEAIRNEKVKVLEAIRPMSRDEIARHTVRGQYGGGKLGSTSVPAYRQEVGVSPTSSTETYAALELYVENWRWANVPFYLRSGKRLGRRDTEIVIQFKRPPLALFQKTGLGEIGPNRLVIHVQPDEGIDLEMKAKLPGARIQLVTTKLSFSYADFGDQPEATGYERLLYDCMIGDSTLFHREDMVRASWQIATPILEAWAEQSPTDFPNYPSGSWGPRSADDLLARSGRSWVVPDVVARHNP
jgi:glucose-6-phosphate 1-dehydrogenase